MPHEGGQPHGDDGVNPKGTVEVLASKKIHPLTWIWHEAEALNHQIQRSQTQNQSLNQVAIHIGKWHHQNRQQRRKKEPGEDFLTPTDLLTQIRQSLCFYVHFPNSSFLSSRDCLLRKLM